MTDRHILLDYALYCEAVALRSLALQLQHISRQTRTMPVPRWQLLRNMRFHLGRIHALTHINYNDMITPP